MAVTLKSRIPEITAELPAKVGEAVHAGTERLADSMRDRAPVLSGSLRDSIDVEQTGPQSAEIKALFYWYFVEYGTRYDTAQPFIRPAVESTTPEMIAGIRRALAEL